MSTVTNKQAPIGVFDSGVGGLTVAKEIRKQLPHESIIYLGDTARTPYGTKAGETVTRFTLECVNQLNLYKIKALVVACNTASAYALPTLRRHFKIPILGVIKPGSRAALREESKGPIGVIGTRATISSDAYSKTIQQMQATKKVVAAACPLLVPLVEEGWLDSDVSKKIIRQYLSPVMNKGVERLILGCTHYPALKSLIAKVCGKKVTIIDSAEEITKELKMVLNEHNLLNRQKRQGSQRYLVTDVPDQFVRVGTHIFGKRIKNVRRVTLVEAKK